MAKAKKPKIEVFYDGVHWRWDMHWGRLRVCSWKGWHTRAVAWRNAEAVRDAMAKAEIVEEKR